MFDEGYWKRPKVANGEKFWLMENGYNFTGLDVGCGTGKLMNKKMIGITLSKWEVDECRKKGLNVIQCDARKMLFPNNSFNEVLCSFLIEHMLPSDALKVVKECFRVLKKGGKAYLVTEQFNLYFFDDYTHIHPFTVYSLRQLLADAGFRNIKVKRIMPMIKGYNFIGRKIGENILYLIQKITKPFLIGRCKLLGIGKK